MLRRTGLILSKGDMPIGFIEAKDIGDKDLAGIKKTGNKEQFDRYKASLNNLFFTDYLDFHLYRDGQLITKIAIAEITDKGLKPLTGNLDRFENLIKDFRTHKGQTIKSNKKLAEMMAGKARLLSDIIEKALTSDEKNKEDSTLKDQKDLGTELRMLHLLESPDVDNYITQNPIDGNNEVTKPRYVIANDSEAISNNETASFLAVTGKVYINDTQYFHNVPQIAWHFYIGGYQPAQKWLKDRKGRALEFDDILHYQKIIVALWETNRLMKEIDKVAIE